MPTYKKKDGVWSPVKSLFFKQEGEWFPVYRGYTKIAGTWVQVFEAQVTAIVSETTTNLNISTLFSTDDWQSPVKKKIVVIPAGVIVGSANPAIAALLTGTGRGGKLEIVIDGEVQAAGGSPNGGVGGAAINIQQTGAVITNNGAIRSGGGGGGRGGSGGNGGNGYIRNQTNNGFSQGYNEWYNTYSPNRIYIVWNGTYILDAAYRPTYEGIETYNSGGYTYFRYASNGAGTRFAIGRYFDTPTAGGVGGAGGNGGRGRGFAGAADSGLAGSAGSPGGTNAGAGGTGGVGGAGGGWGLPGTSGSAGGTGISGNLAAGSAGASGGTGGSAGSAIIGLDRTLINNGTVNGAIA